MKKTAYFFIYLFIFIIFYISQKSDIKTSIY